MGLALDVRSNEVHNAGTGCTTRNDLFSLLEQLHSDLNPGITMEIEEGDVEREDQDHGKGSGSMLQVGHAAG